jgi:uncharacterized RDD family membrane protein YckC
MGQIEIGTSQNVGIRYEAANVMERILATVIDAVIMLGVLIGLYVTVIMIAVNGTFDSSTTEVLGWVFLGIGILDVLYPVLCETFWNGQTIGKRMMRLRVMRVDGTQPRIVDYFLRWLIGLVEIVLTSGAVAAILIMASQSSAAGRHGGRDHRRAPAQEVHPFRIVPGGRRGRDVRAISRGAATDG